MNHPGRGSESLKAAKVRDMFGAIAQRYDFLNHFLSGNIDRHWRRVCLQEIGTRLGGRQPTVLDVGCGTADLALAFSALGPVTGCDFCHPMLQIGREKSARAAKRYPVNLLGGDALALPFAAGSFDVVVSAFVLRNLANIDTGLLEMRRVLKPGGILGILDFAMPRTPVFGTMYRFYFTRILPKLGRMISGVDGAYLYLPHSVKEFPAPEVLIQRIAQAGFDPVDYRPLTMGVAVLWMGKASGHASE
jgi:demethylmenaquinone methyltransferase/2-methoxy-6-polyprenyl-1,4-benzoquinol methylase